MRWMHIIQLWFELESELNLLLVILSVLGVIFFELLTHLFFICSFTLQFFSILGQRVISIPQDLFVISLLLEFALVITVQFLEFWLMLLWNFWNEHAVIRTATVFQQNGKNFPDVGNQRIFFFSVLETLLNKLVKTNRVYEKSSINSIYEVGGDPRIWEGHPVDTVPGDWVLVLRLEDHSWDVEVFSILQRLINPGLEYFRTHLYLFVCWLKPSIFRLN